MLKSLNMYFKKIVHKESAFFIKQQMENLYFLKANNGLYADIHFDDDTMYVCVSSIDNKNKPIERFSYFSKKNNTATTGINFIIESMQNNIVFYLDEKDIEHFFITNSNLYKDYILYKMMKKNFNIEDNPQYRDSFLFFNNKKYGELSFFKKRIIGNIYKFKFFRVCESSCYNKININYIINDELFELSTMEELKKSLTDYKLTNKFFSSKSSPDIKESYGFNGNLNESMNNLIKLCNLKKIRILKKGKDFCFFKKSSNQIVLRYLLNYDIFNSKLTHCDDKILYVDNQLVLMTYTARKITVSKSAFGFNKAMAHQFDILSMASNKLDSFKCHYPSDYLLKTLSDLGMPYDLPLSSEAIKVVEMFET